MTQNQCCKGNTVFNLTKCLDLKTFPLKFKKKYESFLNFDICIKINIET